MKKFFGFILAMLMTVTLAVGCKKDDGENNISLADVNKFLNLTEKAEPGKIVFQMDMGNTVAVIPFTHINGPKQEWYFYALVNFQYDMGSYVRYQVTYLSCTCRDANVNYWSTAYVELTKPTKPENTRLKALSYDLDGSGHYTAGFWGDSDPIPNGTTYQDIKDDFIPLLINKTKTEIAAYNTVDDMLSGGAMDQATYDAFTGASVSTNNILRILHALFEYHANTWWTE